MQLGSVELEGGQDRIVAWWSADAARSVIDVSWEEAIDLLARVLARYAASPSRFIDARRSFGRLRHDGAVLPLRLAHDHWIALLKPWALERAAAGPDPHLVAVVHPAGLAAPILVGEPSRAQRVASYLRTTDARADSRVFSTEPGVRRVESHAAELALGRDRTTLEEHVDSALRPLEGPQGRPLLRRRPQDRWIDDFTGGLAE